MNQTYMKEKPVLPLLASMALPMVLSMLVNSLYNIVDSYFVAKISEDAMTALSLVFPIQNFVSSTAVGFGVGINAAISISLGAGDQKRANQATTQGTMLSILHGIVLSVLCIVIMPGFLAGFHATQQAVSYGIRYSNIVFCFASMTIVGVTFEKIFQAVGKMNVSMFSMIVGCVTNIILDPILIFGYGIFPEMGIEGAALATGIGQTVTLAIYLLIYKLHPINVKVSRKYMKPDGEVIAKLYLVGIPATLNMALTSLLIVVLNGILATFSQLYVLVLGIYYKLQTFLYLPANGMIQGMRPLIGYNYGAREEKRVRKIYHGALMMNAVIMLIGTVICMSVPEKLMEMFTQNPETVLEGAKALRIISMGFLISTVPVTVSGALEGIGKGGTSLIISLCRYVFVIIPIAFILSLFMRESGVWIAFPATEILTAVLSVVLSRQLSVEPEAAGEMELVMQKDV